MFELKKSTSPTTTLLSKSTTVTEGNFPKLCVIVHLMDATSKHCVYVPLSAIISAKSKIVHTFVGVSGQDMLAFAFTVANGSTNTPFDSVATTILELAEFCQSHISFLRTACSKSV